MNDNIETIKNAFQTSRTEEIENSYFEKIYYFLINIRYLNDEFLYYPKEILTELFSDNKGYTLVYYPCDIIELRQIIKNGFKANDISIFLSFDFAKKHCLDNPILLGVETKVKDYGNIFISTEEKIAIKRIYIREECLQTEINALTNKIVQEEKLDVDINVISDIEGFKNKKILSFNLKQINKISQKNEISLNSKEEEIFSFIKQFKKDNPAFLNVKTYVVGGWTRDKLLGLESDDIDIAINNVSGFTFANALFEYAKQKGIQNVNEPHSLNVVEKSAQPKIKTTQDLDEEGLKGGGLNIFGQKIEFIRMRTETYPDPISRQPKVSPSNDIKEDVVRRDLTINSLYYNIDTGKVEDYVNGKEDLKNMVLKTPSDPYKTFIDDPLRMLRVLRFYSRYPNAKIDPAIIEVMKESSNPNSDFSKAFRSKVSPDRGAKEIRKMMQSDKAVEATRYLLETDFYKLVFQIPEKWHHIKIDQQNEHHRLDLMEHTLSVMDQYRKIAKKINLPKEEQGLMMISSLLHDFGKMSPEIRKENPKKPGHMRYIGHEDESAKFSKDIMTKMGFEPSEKKFVETIIKNHMLPHTFVENDKIDPKKIGKFLNETGELYKRIMEHGQADALAKNLKEEEIQDITKQREESLKRIEEYRKEMGQMVYKPIIDGNKIKQIVEEVSPEVVKNNTKIITKDYLKPVHYMTFIMDQLMKQQWNKKVMNEEQAIIFVKGIAKQVLEIEKQNKKMVNNNIKKQAHTPTGEGSESGMEGAGIGYEGSQKKEKARDTVFMNYSVPSRFKEGTKVRLNTTWGGGGLAFQQIEGIVKSIKNNKMIIEWRTGKYKGKKSGFDLTDTVSIAKLDVIT